MDVSWIGIQWRAISNLAAATTKRAFNSHHHLLAAKQGVADELASSQGNGSVVIRHGCGLECFVSLRKVTKERLGGLASWFRSWEKGLAAKLKPGH